MARVHPDGSSLRVSQRSAAPCHSSTIPPAAFPHLRHYHNDNTRGPP